MPAGSWHCLNRADQPPQLSGLINVCLSSSGFVVRGNKCGALSVLLWSLLRKKACPSCLGQGICTSFSGLDLSSLLCLHLSSCIIAWIFWGFICTSKKDFVNNTYNKKSSIKLSTLMEEWAQCLKCCYIYWRRGIGHLCPTGLHDKISTHNTLASLFAKEIVKFPPILCIFIFLCVSFISGT